MTETKPKPPGDIILQRVDLHAAHDLLFRFIDAAEEVDAERSTAMCASILMACVALYGDHVFTWPVERLAETVNEVNRLIILKVTGIEPPSVLQ